MIELVLIVLCSWQINRLAVGRGLAGWKWIANFISGYFAFGILLGVSLVLFYGIDATKDFKAMQELITPWSPYILLVMVLWFMFLRSRIMQYEELNDDDTGEDISSNESSISPETSENEKKDLSYFR